MSRQPSQADLVSIIDDLRRRVKIMETAPRLGHSSIGAGGLLVNKGGFITIEAPGTLNVGGPATFSDDTTIGGNLAVTGTLSLPGGIIDNDALANPLQPVVDRTRANNFSITTSESVRATLTIPVPAGFSRAVASATAQLTAVNGQAVNDYVLVGVDMPGEVNLGYKGQALGLAGDLAFVTTQAVGLPNALGANLTITANVATGFGTWVADLATSITLTAMVIFLR